jgi:putative oxidoreductase
MQNTLRIAGRLGVAAFFILAGINKVLNPAQTQAMIDASILAPLALIYYATFVFEIAAGLTLALDGPRAAYAAVALALFTVATNLVFHRFWEITGPMAQPELSMFFKNIAIAFALLYIAAVEWGPKRITDAGPT